MCNQPNITSVARLPVAPAPAPRKPSLAKPLSKTLAAELATRALAIPNPANRRIALDAALRRHGFTPITTPAPLTDRAELITWLLTTYALS